MATCDSDNSAGDDCPRTLSEAVAFFLSQQRESSLASDQRSRTPPAKNRESKIYQHIQLFENTAADRPGNFCKSCSMSTDVKVANEPFYVNLQDIPLDAVPRLRRQSAVSTGKRRPMPIPRSSVIAGAKTEKPFEIVASVSSATKEACISPRRKSLDIPRKVPPLRPPPPPPASRSRSGSRQLDPVSDFRTNFARFSIQSELIFDPEVGKFTTPLTSPRGGTIAQLSPLQAAEFPTPVPINSDVYRSTPGGLPRNATLLGFGSIQPYEYPEVGKLVSSPTSSSRIANSGHGSSNYPKLSNRPLPETPRHIEEDDAYAEGCNEPMYEEIACNANPKVENCPKIEEAFPVMSGRTKRTRPSAKNFRSLRGLPQELEQPRPKPRASSFTTADLAVFPPRLPFSPYPHSVTCSSMSLTESDSGVSLEQESNKDDSSLLYMRHGVSYSSGEFQKIMEKVKGFQCRSESLKTNDARVKNPPKVLNDKNRRHTLPVVSVLPTTVFDNNEDDRSQRAATEMDTEISHYPSRSLWCQQPTVLNSGILEKLTDDQRKLQEAVYEIICSEASHLRSLNILIKIFKSAPELTSAGKSNPGEISLSIVSPQEERNLFLNIADIRKISHNLLKQLHERRLQYLLSNGQIDPPDFSDLLENFAMSESKAYVNYCSNQLFQDRTLKGLKERKRFQEVVRRLESHPSCELLDFRSYLMLPMQRITRLPLLLSAVIKRLEVTSCAYGSYNNALAAVNKVVKDCDEGAKRCACIEELCRIDAVLQFDVSLKKIPIISASRCLVKRGTVDMIQIEHKLLPRRSYHKKSVHLLVFNDLFMLTRPRSGSEEALTVLDYCPRNLLDCLPVSSAERDELLAHTSISAVFTTRDSFRGVKLVLLRNHAQKTVEFFIVMTLESDYMRWMSVLNPSEKVDGDEKVYEVWDCPQFEIMSDYEAKENDELSLAAGDVVDIYRKSSDGWMEGRRISDGHRGWLPTDIARELMTEHARARILKERNRLLTASAQFMQDRYKTITL